MTTEEKEENPNYGTIGGYIKELEYQEAWELWWGNLTFEEKKIIQTIPNFDENIFFEITGIVIKEGENK